MVGQKMAHGILAIDMGEHSYDLDVAYLEDGQFNVTLMSVLGDFYIDKSELRVTYEPVPEPGTMLTRFWLNCSAWPGPQEI